MNFLQIDGQGYTDFNHRKKLSRIDTPLFPPLGLLYIGRALEDEGFGVEIRHFFDEDLSKRKIKKSL